MMRAASAARVVASCMQDTLSARDLKWKVYCLRASYVNFSKKLATEFTSPYTGVSGQPRGAEGLASVNSPIGAPYSLISGKRATYRDSMARKRAPY